MGNRLPNWANDAYDHLTPRFLDREDGILRDNAVTDFSSLMYS